MPDVVTGTFDPQAARQRLISLVVERAYRDGVDIVLASGKRSDFYINGKQITLHPEGLFLTARLMLEELATLPDVTAFGGLTMGADPIAGAVCALSHDIGRPIDAFLVRKEPKGHGTGSLIEGTLEPGQKVVVVEDTITTGGSALKAVDAVRAAGADPVAIFALCDREDPEGDEFRAAHDVRSLIKVTELRNHG